MKTEILANELSAGHGNVSRFKSWKI